MPAPRGMAVALAAAGAVRCLRWATRLPSAARSAACTCTDGFVSHILRLEGVHARLLRTRRDTTPPSPHAWLRRASRMARRGRVSILLREGLLCEAHGAQCAAAFAGRLGALGVLDPPAYVCNVDGWAALGGHVRARPVPDRSHPHPHHPYPHPHLRHAHPDPRWVWDSAAFAGRVHTLLRHAPPASWDDRVLRSACEAAAHGGCVRTLRWMRRRGHPGSDGAARCGGLRALRWVIAHGVAASPAQLWADAAMRGHVRSMRWLLALGYAWDRQACRNAARGGHVDVLRWLRRHGAPWGPAACEAAARHGHLPALRWMRRQRPPCPWDERTCTAAACDQRLGVLRWLRRQRPPCPWGADVCEWALFTDQRAILTWARDQGAPFSDNARRYARIRRLQRYDSYALFAVVAAVSVVAIVLLW